MEANRPGVMSTQRKCIRRSQGCMAAQVIFHYRCEPTQVKIAISTGDHKSCFAVTVLRCDFLHDIIGRKCGNETYTRRIAREQFVREGIDLVIRNWHAHQSITVQKPLTGRLVGNPEIGICGPDARCRQTGGSLALSMSSNPHGHRWIRSRWPPLYGRRNGRPPHRPGVKIEKLEPGHVAEAGD